MTEKIGVGLISYGYSAKTFHLPFLKVSESYEVRKIFSRTTPSTESTSEIKITNSLDDLLENPTIDLIVVTSPNNLHFEHAHKALSHHKHVVVEKPFVLEESEGKILMDLAAKENRILTVYQNRRWDSDFLTVQRLMNEKNLGEIFYFESRYDRFRPEVKDRWKENETQGGGLLRDLGSHLVDQALQLFGKPAKILADCAQQRPHAEATDYFRLLFYYPTGLRVILGGSNLCLEPGPKFSLHGTRGSFIKFGNDPQEDDLKGSGYVPDENWGRELEIHHGTLTTLTDKGLPKRSVIASERGRYQDFYRELALAITQQLPPPVDPRSSLEVIRLINLCLQSSREGKVLSV